MFSVSSLGIVLMNFGSISHLKEIQFVRLPPAIPVLADVSHGRYVCPLLQYVSACVCNPSGLAFWLERMNCLYQFVCSTTRAVRLFSRSFISMLSCRNVITGSVTKSFSHTSTSVRSLPAL